MMLLIYMQNLFFETISVISILIVLSIPVFFIWRWLLKKFIKVEKTRRLVTWIATVLSTPLILSAILWIFIMSLFYYPNHQFSQEKWFAGKEKRYELSEDIIANKILIGKTKKEVRQILGEGDFEGRDQWTYYLGMVPGFSIDLDLLDIEFKNGKVVSVIQRRT